jgi:protease secretion system membrane fusion protein
MANLALLKSAPSGTTNDMPAALADAPPDTLPVTGYADTRRASRVGLWALAIGFGGFLLWASFAPLDEGVAAPGLVSIDTHRKPVQHLTGGIVKEVLVREGQQVKEDQVLVRLDPATSKANFEQSRQKYMTLRAMEGRLVAEQTRSGKITFHPDLVQESGDPMIKSLMTTQEQLLAARQANLGADLQSLRQQIEGQQQSVQAYKSMIESRKTQLSLLTEELRNTRGLVSEGYAPRTRQWELERNVADVSAALSDLQGNILRTLASVGDLRSRLVSREQDYRKEIEQQMADVKSQVQAEAERYRALRDDLARIEIKSPAAGQVVGLAVQTPGGVIQPAQKLMDIVPSDEPLLLEAKVQPNFIDRVHAGLPVDIRFNSFAHSPTLVVDGKVLSVSKDLITDPNNPNMAYYLARVQVTPEGMHKLGPRQLQAGMPTEMIFRTGERSLLNYLLGPLYKRMSASMKEA